MTSPLDTVVFGIARVPHDRIDVTAGSEVVCIFVNGRELAEAVEQGSRAHRSGRDAASLFGPPPAAWVLPPSRHWLGEPDPGLAKDGWSVLYTCSCGDWECGALLTRIEADERVVTWSGFLTPYELDLLAEDPGTAPEALGGARRELGPFRFDREAYETALRAPALVPWPYDRDGAAG
ncbi:MAG: hypothetical protein ACRDJO_13000 [Actinomycetota bacterium]